MGLGGQSGRSLGGVAELTTAPTSYSAAANPSPPGSAGGSALRVLARARDRTARDRRAAALLESCEEVWFPGAMGWVGMFSLGREEFSRELCSGCLVCPSPSVTFSCRDNRPRTKQRARRKKPTDTRGVSGLGLTAAVLGPHGSCWRRRGAAATRVEASSGARAAL